MEALSSPEILSQELAALNAGQRIAHLYQQFGSRLVSSTSFGIQAAVMLHLIHEHAPKTPIIFIDTGFLFPETYQYIEQLQNRLPNLDLRTYLPTYSAARIQALWGNLWETSQEGADKYGLITKVEPMDRALREIGADVWLSGVRRAHSKTRAERTFAEQQKRTLKVYPILDWSDSQVQFYMNQHDLPAHPLAAKGYVTMGDWHSTQPISDDADAESTRFGGAKYECGLHISSGVSDFQI